MSDGGVPTVDRAEQYLRDEAKLNPGPWVRHSEHVAMAALQEIAADPERTHRLTVWTRSVHDHQPDDFTP